MRLLMRKLWNRDWLFPKGLFLFLDGFLRAVRLISKPDVGCQPLVPGEGKTCLQ